MIEAHTPGRRAEARPVESANDRDNSLRAALFGVPDDAEPRVLERLGVPVRKQTISDLGRPNGARSSRLRIAR